MQRSAPELLVTIFHHFILSLGLFADMKPSGACRFGNREVGDWLQLCMRKSALRPKDNTKCERWCLEALLFCI
ncbi:hypothetical protein XELAEV_18014754mg [Xenopus laevis]|uniref:Secreted protein n=1 Tax=Xenopus laevis TaxID=8355 RepID=A0A974DGT8_XENLA|nr:hypothetical protein XELAEV_18014754mg [Xenopus laevis]